MLTALDSFSGMSVDDIQKAREFYVDTLQFEVVDEKMGVTLELPGGSRVFLYEKANHEPATYTALNFVVENIDEAVEHLKEHGITFEHYDELPFPQDENEISRGKESGEGPDIAWFTDPAGNILSVMES